MLSCAWEAEISLLTHRWAAAALRYALVFLTVGAALFITIALHPTLFPTPLFFAAIVVSTWYGGVGPGILAVLLATFTVDFYFVPPFHIVKAGVTDVPYLAQFALPALLSSWFVKKRKDAEAALRDARDQLEVKVQQRTAELRQANEQLQAEMAERKRAEEAFHAIQANLAHLSRVMTMSELTTSIAHEVNQPLAAVVTNGDACRRWLSLSPPNVERARHSAAQIIQEATRASAVIKRVRDLSRKAIAQPENLDINQVIDEVLGLLASELAQNRVQISTDFGSVLPTIIGDRVQLQQVVLNLIVNAIEALKPVQDRARRIRVSSRVNAPRAVEVSVRDNGVGMKASELEHLFEAFFTTKPRGLGMGLSISRTIIESHGGRLWAEANPEFGAAFHFELPTSTELRV
jgi:C4-dicarboxylate-specific signal transduction histidine kinase